MSQYGKTMFSAAAKHLQKLHHSREQYERLAAQGSSNEALITPRFTEKELAAN